MDCSPPGSSVHGLSQARILEWGALSFSRESSWPTDRTHTSWIGRWVLYYWATREAAYTLPCLLHAVSKSLHRLLILKLHKESMRVEPGAARKPCPKPSSHLEQLFLPDQAHAGMQVILCSWTRLTPKDPGLGQLGTLVKSSERKLMQWISLLFDDSTSAPDNQCFLLSRVTL